MGQRFVACDREQSLLMPPDVLEWLPPRHLAWFVIDAVAEMDFEAFYGAYRLDGRSRPPYDPAMMVALLLYAYARGDPVLAGSSARAKKTSPSGSWRPSSGPITRRWRGSSCATRRRSRSVRRSAHAVRAQRARHGRRDRRRRNEGAGQRVARREPRLRAVGARDRGGGQGD